MLESEKICMDCGRKIFASWIECGDFDLIGVENNGYNNCVFIMRSNKISNGGKIYEIMCEVGDEPEMCKYYLERMVVLDAEEKEKR